MTSEQLLFELQSDLHNTCKKYNLCFKFKSGYWTLISSNDNKSKYLEYSGEYKNFPAKIEFTVQDKCDAIAFILLSSLTVYNAIHGVVENSYKKYIKPSVENKEMSIMDNIITRTASISVAVIAVISLVRKIKK